MGRYLLRRLLIAVPSLLGISVVLFVVLALATLAYKLVPAKM